MLCQLEDHPIHEGESTLRRIGRKPPSITYSPDSSLSHWFFLRRCSGSILLTGQRMSTPYVTRATRDLTARSMWNITAPLATALFLKTCQRTLKTCLEKCIHIIVGTADINSLRPEMRLKSSPDEIVCSQSTHEERHLKIAISFHDSTTKCGTHGDLFSGNLALLIECVDDSFDGFVEQACGLFPRRYKISPC